MNFKKVCVKSKGSAEVKSMSTFFLRLFALHVAVILISVVVPRISDADTRTDYLINMLDTGKNYRLRVQAATTLGKLRAQEAVPALVKAAADTDELVVISAAIALKQIGDSSVVPQLEKVLAKAPSEAARSQLAMTLRILSEIGHVKPPIAAAPLAPKFLVRVDAMGNSSASGNKDLPLLMRDLVVERLQKERDILLQPSDWKSEAVLKKIKQDRLQAYIISGSIIRMEKVDNQLAVRLSLNVFTNPDYSLIMMPTSEASIEINPSATKPEDDPNAVKAAIRAIADSLVSSIFDNIRQGAVP
jgi:hypothetical protein